MYEATWNNISDIIDFTHFYNLFLVWKHQDMPTLMEFLKIVFLVSMELIGVKWVYFKEFFLSQNFFKCDCYYNFSFWRSNYPPWKKLIQNWKWFWNNPSLWNLSMVKSRKPKSPRMNQNGLLTSRRVWLSCSKLKLMWPLG